MSEITGLAARVLLLDDEADFAHALRRFLSHVQPEWLIDLLDDPRAAMHSICANAYDLVIVDYVLGADLSGLDVIREGRRAGFDGAMVILTGKRNSLAEAEEAVALGADDHVVKSDDGVEVHRRLRLALTRRAAIPPEMRTTPVSVIRVDHERRGRDVPRRLIYDPFVVDDDLEVALAQNRRLVRVRGVLYRLFRLLVANAECVVNRTDPAVRQLVFGVEPSRAAWKGTVYRLRKALSPYDAALLATPHGALLSRCALDHPPPSQLRSVAGGGEPGRM